MYLLRQKPFVILAVLASLFWSTLLVFHAQHGKTSTGELVAMAAIGLVVGVGSAVILLICGFMAYRRIFTKQPSPRVSHDEKIMLSLKAHHFIDGEGRGGRLYATKQRLVFCPHRYNVQLALFTAAWSDIAGLSTQFPNFLFIDLKDGRRERIRISTVKTVVTDLERVREHALRPRSKRAPQDS